jgi:hypothetical protein
MIVSAVLAVALGLTPVKDSAAPQLVLVDDKVAAQIGPYKQKAGRDGRTHLYGFDRLGRAYDIAIDSNGHVEGQVGDWYVTYDISDAA